MSFPIDHARMDLREAFDFAIRIEEDAQRRYEQLAAAFPGDPSGIADVFRTMAVNERKHRTELAQRRYEMLREDPQASELRVADGDMEGPEPQANPRTLVDALELVLASERRALAFYTDALEHVTDPAVRTLFEDLRDEEAEHERFISSVLAKHTANAA